MPHHPLTPYHLVHISPWPLVAPIFAASTLISGLAIFNNTSPNYIVLIISALLIAVASLWWRDVIREATLIGDHTINVQVGLSLSIIMFIASEVIFFFAFFWAFFHSSLSPTQEIGAQWPPTSITPLNPFSVPLLNTGVLLSSGVTVTWAHHSILNNDLIESAPALALTISLGVYFTSLQYSEYVDASFSFNDSVYGSSFFLATGFHGAHVLIGSTFLTVCFFRLLLNHMSSAHHFGFEAAAWYWHFVDVVWIFLYIFLYWWGAA